MKRIIFGLQTMVMGGVEKELISIMRHLDASEWDVTVVVMYIQDASIISQIPKWVRFINLDIDRNYYCSDTLTVAKLRAKRGRFLEATSLLAKKVLGKGQTGSNVYIKDIPDIEGEFDTAICYHMHSPLMVRYVAEKISAKKKIAWIHNDFVTSGYRPDRILRYLSMYDEFIGVSKKITDEFISLCPTLQKRTDVVYNALDVGEILRLSQESLPSEFEHKVSKRLFFLTVGRMEEQKGYDIAVAAAAELRDKGVDFIWAFIGSGSREKEIRDLIETNNLCDKVISLGRIDNPYPYMRRCDIYIQPSRHEGYPLTVLEAKMLEKPIVCTDFAGADEQIEDGINGRVIAKNRPNELAEAIHALCKDKRIMEKFSGNLHKENLKDSGFSEITSRL